MHVLHYSASIATSADNSPLPLLHDNPQASDLHAQQQQLQEDLVETAELRVKVSRMREVVADLPALQEELQQLQAAHEASLEQSRQLQAKVRVERCVCA